MKLRHFALAACLFSCQMWGTGLAQQAASAPALTPPEPHPLPAAAPGGAAAYNVEVIVFRTTATLGSPENWSVQVAQAPAIPSAADGEAGTPGSDPPPPAAATAPTPGARFVRALTPAEFQLGDLEARLKSSSSYVPVAHVGWVQTASPWGAHESMSLQQLGFDAPLLSGTVQLERGQFLHLGFSLNLTIANPPPGLGAPPQTTFVLNDNHRVKLYERNYFDAPAFGVIALVAPAQGTRRAGR
ncbi:MAG TPA: CsiV family protein [Steroidobacteraceae bacterium]|nr:CsiV family protein [Steroidobacteraceae bacterium]